MSFRRLVLSTLVLAAAALGPAAGSVLAKVRTLQTSASGSGTDFIPVLGGSSYTVSGTVNGTLGPGTFQGGGTQTGPTSFTVMNTTAYADGTLTQSGTGIDTGTFTSTSMLTVVSGTGRFRGATGSSTLMATATPTSDPQTRDLTFTATGTITLRHHGKKRHRR
jgi:hypothetical protein